MKLQYLPMVMRYNLARVRCAIVRERYPLGLSFIVLLGAVLIWVLIPSKPKEVALYIGQPFDEIQKSSTYPLDPWYPRNGWTQFITKPVVLRFSDPKYGFVLPPTKLLSISYSNSRVIIVDASPQLETLPLDEALALAESIRAQLIKGGWVLDEDDLEQEGYPEVYSRISQYPGGPKGRGPTQYWRADNKYRLYFYFRRFTDPDGKWNGKYLITIEVSRLHYPE